MNIMCSKNGYSNSVKKYSFLVDGSKDGTESLIMRTLKFALKLKPR